jgi:hypothetical protein
MAQWRIRVIVPDGPGGLEALESALAQVPANGVQVTPNGSDSAEIPGDVIVELGEESSLPDLLRTLHEISPQVFISRVTPDEVGAADRPIRVRKLGRAVSVTG